ncbi:MAG: DNA polymerase III subunit beta [Lachnospiraceae bacterium]|nr:DNA polymerase III subunit beta [Lachnospiraceae bacterium]
MKFTAMKAELLSAVNVAIRAVPAHTTMPILYCILMEASGRGLTFTTNDMEMGIETHVNASIEEEGIVAVEAKIFSDIVRKLPDEMITVEADENLAVNIRCGKTKFAIGGQSGDDFSYLPNVERETEIELSQFSLKNVIQETIFSIAGNENNKIMTGELFDVRENVLRVVALDGHRIAMRRVPLEGENEPVRVIVPGKTLSEIGKILTGEIDDRVRIFFTRNHMVFEMEKTRIVTRLIEGEYFNVDQMISSDYETKVTVNRTSFLSCIDRATLFVKEGDKKPIIIDIEDGYLRLSIESPLGSMDEELDVEKEGRDLTIGFNPRFMIDALRVIDDENVTLYLVNPKAPCFIRDEAGSYTYLILPVNFSR